MTIKQAMDVVTGLVEAGMVHESAFHDVVGVILQYGCYRAKFATDKTLEICHGR